jgi:hypothetical protein
MSSIFGSVPFFFTYFVICLYVVQERVPTLEKNNIFRNLDGFTYFQPLEHEKVVFEKPSACLSGCIHIYRSLCIYGHMYSYVRTIPASERAEQ